uniref:Ribonuclease H-like domain-containing protein n=1 Tax=Tanacetum cinerariifolium TaxID=118510 RepID=A0A6L2JHU8_TANCI|nr:ribonuclease H-like domain-containing protein [Tanacetum cinerariifolium]
MLQAPYLPQVYIATPPFGQSVQDYQTDRLLPRCDSTGDLYPVTLQPPIHPPFALLSFSYTIWHRRLGHLVEDVLRRLESSRLIFCNKSKVSALRHVCQLDKHVKLPFYSSASNVASVFEIIHSDLWTSPIPSESGIKYYAIFLDHFSHFVWVYPLLKKFDLFDAFVSFSPYVNNQFNVNIKALQCDHGGEYDNTRFHDLFRQNGIQFRFSCPRTSQQNGKSERMLRTINNLIRTLLFQAYIPTSTDRPSTPPTYDFLLPIAAFQPTAAPPPTQPIIPHSHNLLIEPTISPTTPSHNSLSHQTQQSLQPHSPTFAISSHNITISLITSQHHSAQATPLPQTDPVQFPNTQIPPATQPQPVSTHPIVTRAKADGSLSRYKARHVANERSQQQGIDYDETFSLVIKPATIRTVLSLGISREWPIYQLDVKNAFLYGQLSEIVYMHQPSGDRRQACFCLKAKFTEEIIERAHMQNCNPCKTLVDIESKLGLDADLVSDPTLYRNLAGAFQYLTFTRTNLSYVFQQVCLYMHDPRDPYFTALKRILRYVRGTLDYGLQLHVSSTTQLTAYTDADWAGFHVTHRSTSGYCMFLGDNLLSWLAKRQVTLSHSSAKAKYRGVANVVVETSWIRNLLRELHTSLFIATLV